MAHIFPESHSIKYFLLILFFSCVIFRRRWFIGTDNKMAFVQEEQIHLSNVYVIQVKYERTKFTHHFMT